MTFEIILLGIIVALEIARWIYDFLWSKKEDRILKEQTDLLEDLVVTLEIKENQEEKKIEQSASKLS